MRTDLMHDPAHNPAAALAEGVTLECPSNLYKPKNPLTVTLLENTKLTGDASPNDVRHLTFQLSGTDYWFLDGQSVGVLPPGTDEAGKPHKLRLYSIASQGVLANEATKQLSTCVKRLVYTNEAGQEVSGVCSNYLCDLEPGATLEVTGPVGKEFLMPTQANANLVMIATGTGIAPFRAFLKTRYTQRAKELGHTHLFFGVQYSDDILYRSELETLAQQWPTFGLHVAVSREQKTPTGERMYVQHKLAEQANKLLPLLEQANTYVYICGLKGMETGILQALEAACAQQGKVWNELFAELKSSHRWRVEVY
jgi:ferredoxin--NADP+ reductase